MDSSVKRSPIAPVSARRQRESRKYAKVRELVMDRDEWSCKVGHWPDPAHRGMLVTHHVISRARAPLLWLDPDNLLTLCWDHHVAVHANVALATERGLIRSAGGGGAG
jgi:5-methylcytosine-specific restriction endonuclease McrA